MVVSSFDHGELFALRHLLAYRSIVNSGAYENSDLLKVILSRSARSARRASASRDIERNFRIWNGRPWSPTRTWRNRIESLSVGQYSASVSMTVSPKASRCCGQRSAPPAMLFRGLAAAGLRTPAAYWAWAALCAFLVVVLVVTSIPDASFGIGFVLSCLLLLALLEHLLELGHRRIAVITSHTPSKAQERTPGPRLGNMLESHTNVGIGWHRHPGDVDEALVRDTARLRQGIEVTPARGKHER